MRKKLLIAAFLLSTPAFAGPSIVGNGDDGADLEGTTPVAGGPILAARGKAVELVRRIGADGVAGLGTLLPEVEKAPLYLARKDSPSELAEDHGAFHSDMRGLVFARTLPQPHAATRFFPVSEKLEESQLVALQIHEALHRALPESVREDESAVAAITLSITAPGANQDQLRSTVARVVPAGALAPEPSLASRGAAEAPSPEGAAGTSVATEAYPIPEDARIKQPSTVGYSYRHFQAPKGAALYPVSAMHEIKSFLYPFGSDRVPLGLGLEASLIQLGGGQGSAAGPLGLSARLRLWSGRGFDIGGWATYSMNTLSAEELKNSPIGRDVATVGLSMRKELKRMYFENFLSLSLPGSAQYPVGSINYTYSYGSVVNASAHAGFSLWKLKIGAFGEYLVSDYFRVATTDSSSYSFDTGRYRVISGGPELAYVDRDFAVEVAGRFMLDASKDVNYDYLGNLMGQGVGQGSLTASLSVFF